MKCNRCAGQMKPRSWAVNDLVITIFACLKYGHTGSTEGNIALDSAVKIFK